MPTIKVNDQEYDLNSLSDQAKAQLGNLQFVEAEIKRLQNQIVVLNTARSVYAQAFIAQLPKAS